MFSVWRNDVIFEQVYRYQNIYDSIFARDEKNLLCIRLQIKTKL